MQILERYLEPVLQTGVDTLILGCTHYPVLNPAIRRVVGPDMHLIDSADVLAEQLRYDIDRGLISKGAGTGNMIIWATDLAESFAQVGKRIMDPYKTCHWQLADIQPVTGTG